MYEDKATLHKYLLFHYGSTAESFPFDFGPKQALHFPQRTVASADQFLRSCAACNGMEATPKPTRALDLGCSVGGSSFELAKRFSSVLGIDFSETFIDAAKRLAAGESIAYNRIDEGEITTRLTAQAPKLNQVYSTPQFAHADACNLPQQILAEPMENFDLVHAANLLCRLPKPAKLLERLPKLVKTGGLLVLATPASWLEEYTPKSEWTGGRLCPSSTTNTSTTLPEITKKEASTKTTAKNTMAYLQEYLQAHFQLLHTEDCPFLLREHARSYQWGVSLLSIWEKT